MVEGDGSLGPELGPNAGLLALKEHFSGKDWEMIDLVDLGEIFSLMLGREEELTLSIRQWVRPFVSRIT